VVGQELTVALGLFARTARSLHLYSPNNQARAKMLADLGRAFGRVFDEADSVTVAVRPDAFFFEDRPVLEEGDADPPVPYLFFRDGVRRIELSKGLSELELERLVDAAAHGLSRRGFDDDIVSILWRDQFEHLKYVTVDTTIIEVDGQGPAPTVDVDVDAELTAVLYEMFGKNAQEIAESLSSPRQRSRPPRYAPRLREEVAAESDAQLMELAASAAAEGYRRAQDPADSAWFSAALLSIFDAALIEERVALLKRIVEWIGQSELMSSLLSEERVKLLATLARPGTPLEFEMMEFFRACGRSIVPALVGLLPSLTDPTQRRAYAELALAMGTEDIHPILGLLDNEQGFVAAQALHMLVELKKLDREAAHAAMRHPKPQVRLTVLQLSERLDADVAEDVVIDLLEDRETRVRTEALRLLGNINSPRAKAAIEALVSNDDFAETSAPVKEAILKTYVALLGRASLERMDELIRATDRLLSGRESEEAGVAAVAAVASLPTPRSVEILKAACLSKNKKVRELARNELKRLRKDFE
jgi:hypothetical protein